MRKARNVCVFAFRKRFLGSGKNFHLGVGWIGLNWVFGL